MSTQLEIQEQTLKNISQEIHDNIGQVLSLAKLNLATTDIDQKEAARQKVDDSKNLVAKAIQDLRDLSKSLNTDYVTDMGLARSIEYELEMLKKTGSFDTDFEIEGGVYKLEKQKELILFRIVQEVLNNVIKHAKASRIAIKLCYQADHFSLKVMDNGQGFDLNNLQDKQNPSRGLGIKNMHNRASLIGGKFSITSIMTEGTSVDIRLPVLSQIM
jgi:two-component system NarL family sensor kinase